MEKSTAIVRSCAAKGLDQLPHDLGKRYMHFNECARQLHEKAQRNCAATFDEYRKQFAEPVLAAA